MKQHSLDSQSTGVVLAEAIGAIREELDDHREAINANTSELQTGFSCMHQLDAKIVRLAERLDELALIVQQLRPDAKVPSAKEDLRITPLTAREKEVFFALYTTNATQPYVSYAQLAKRLLMSESTVAGFVSLLIEKGIPIRKKYHLNRAYVALEESFRELQAKENVVGINAKLNSWMAEGSGE